MHDWDRVGHHVQKCLGCGIFADEYDDYYSELLRSSCPASVV